MVNQGKARKFGFKLGWEAEEVGGFLNLRLALSIYKFPGQPGIHKPGLKKNPTGLIKVIFILYVHVYVQHMCRGQRTTLWSWLFPSISTWVLGIELRWPDEQQFLCPMGCLIDS